MPFDLQSGEEDGMAFETALPGGHVSAVGGGDRDLEDLLDGFVGVPRPKPNFWLFWQNWSPQKRAMVFYLGAGVSFAAFCVIGVVVAADIFVQKPVGAPVQPVDLTAWYSSVPTRTTGPANAVDHPPPAMVWMNTASAPASPSFAASAAPVMEAQSSADLSLGTWSGGIKGPVVLQPLEAPARSTASDTPMAWSVSSSPSVASPGHAAPLNWSVVPLEGVRSPASESRPASRVSSEAFVTSDGWSEQKAAPLRSVAIPKPPDLKASIVRLAPLTVDGVRTDSAIEDEKAIQDMVTRLNLVDRDLANLETEMIALHQQQRDLDTRLKVLEEARRPVSRRAEQSIAVLGPLRDAHRERSRANLVQAPAVSGSRQPKWVVLGGDIGSAYVRDANQEKGEVRSVMQGDVLAGYGQIAKIEETENSVTVIFASGKQIGTNDDHVP